MDHGQFGGSGPKARSARQHTLALVLIPCAIAAGAAAFVVVLVHLPQITGAAIPMFLGAELVIVGGVAAFTSYRFGRNRPGPQGTTPRQRRSSPMGWCEFGGVLTTSVSYATNPSVSGLVSNGGPSGCITRAIDCWLK